MANSLLPLVIATFLSVSLVSCGGKRDEPVPDAVTETGANGEANAPGTLRFEPTAALEGHRSTGLTARISAKTHPALTTGEPLTLEAGDGMLLPLQLDDLDQDGRIDIAFTLADIETVAPIVGQVQGAAPSPPRSFATSEGGTLKIESDVAALNWAIASGEAALIGKRDKSMVLPPMAQVPTGLMPWGGAIVLPQAAASFGVPVYLSPDGPRAVLGEDSALSILAAGPLRSIAIVSSASSAIGGRAGRALHRVEMRAARRWIDHQTTLPRNTPLGTWLPVERGTEIQTLNTDGVTAYWHFGGKTPQGHDLGLAVLVPNALTPAMEATDAGLFITMRPQKIGKTWHARYRVMGGWPLGAQPVMSADQFALLVARAARELAVDIASETQ